MKMKWKPTRLQATYTLYNYTAVPDGKGGYIVEQVEEAPPESCEALDSLFIVSNPDQSDGAAIQITWLKGKPSPDSVQRRAGLLAVMSDIFSRIPEDQKQKWGEIFFGIGHMPGAMAVFHNGERDGDG